MSILASQETTVVVQGITGREATLFTRDALQYNVRIVAGITPGKGGQSVFGVPVYNCVREAMENSSVGASIISVPPLAVRDAVFEAIENGIPLLVIITERVPQKDVSEILVSAKKEGVRIIGPNSLGLICPGETKLGSIGGDLENTCRTFMKGPVGVVSRSGGMTSEIANLLTQNGIGQSTCVSTGGDPLVGSSFKDLFKLFQEDPETKAVVFFCEPGGSMEEEFVEFYRKQTDVKPVFAFVAGRFVDKMPGTRFGHAAVIVEGTRGSAKGKIATLNEAGVGVVEELSELPARLQEAMDCGHVH